MRFSAFKLGVLWVVAAALPLLLLSGCSTFNKYVSGDSVAYQTAHQSKPLDVPPDLTQPQEDNSLAVPAAPGGSATLSQYEHRQQTAAPAAAATQAVLPAHPGMQVQRDGDQYWLVVDAKPAQVWGKVRDFWLQNGFVLTVDKPNLGILETDWAENRANIHGSLIHSFLGKALGSLYSTGTRDKYRVRVEHGLKPGTTEIYITQRGMKQVVPDDYTAGAGGYVWEPTPEDRGLEVEMLRRMMVYLGAKKKQVKQEVASAPQVQRGPRMHMATAADGQETLVLEQPFDQAWRITGLALDQIGFNVQDRDQAHGIYWVRYQDPYKDTGQKRGFLSKLEFWRSDKKKVSDEYQVQVKAEGSSTRVAVLDKDGKPERSGTGKRILNLLREQLQK